MANWYLQKGDQRIGPVPLETLQGMAATGQIAAPDLVWTDGMPAWQPAGSQAWFRAVPPPPPPPTPSMSFGGYAPNFPPTAPPPAPLPNLTMWSILVLPARRYRWPHPVQQGKEGVGAGQLRSSAVNSQKRTDHPDRLRNHRLRHHRRPHWNGAQQSMIAMTEAATQTGQRTHAADYARVLVRPSSQSVRQCCCTITHPPRSTCHHAPFTT